MSSSTVCPCDTFVHPQTITNPPGRSAIAYRVGDYTAFREALLRSNPGEVELVNWRPGAQGDLAVQMVEWWAYLADILTFYNERIANEDYLGTATLPESVRRLIAILGYRPRPGIGGTGILAALMTGNKSFTLPAGFQVQSKPGPGEQPQIFELTSATLVQQPDSISADPSPGPWVASNNSVLLQGAIGGIKVGDELLVLGPGWNTQNSNSLAVTVSAVSQVKDPRGRNNTSVTFNESIAALAAGNVQNYRLLKSAQSSKIWQYPTSASAPAITTSLIDLAAITRGISVGDPVLLDIANPPSPGGFALPPVRAINLGGESGLLSELGAGRTIQSNVREIDPGLLQISVTPEVSAETGSPPPHSLLSVTSYAEKVWYVVPSGDDQTQPPSGSPPPISIPIPHTEIGVAPALSSSITGATYVVSLATLRYAWQDVGTLIAAPATTLTSPAVSLTTPLPAALVPLSGQDILLSDANGNGAEAQASSSDGTNLSLSAVGGPPPPPLPNLVAPLNALFNLLPVTRGQTVSNEILGSGDATVNVGQEFVLQKSPLTYLQDGPGYKSTLQVWVDGVEWQEVPSFYGQPPNAALFVTSEDDRNMTHVQFGDGVYGSRLPSGTNNVVATYRYGSGAASPDPGSLTVILKSWPGLKAIVNPVAAGGGADPDPPQQIKTYAPQSVLTFGRAISADDYEAIAAEAPGVTRARAYWSWDPNQMRMMVKVYVGDDDNAVADARTALAGADDPNRPVNVILATPVPMTLTLALVIGPLYQPPDVLAAVTTAITDPDQGLLGANAVQIGQSIWQSQIYQACQSVPGVVAVHGLQFGRKLEFIGIFESLISKGFGIGSRFNPRIGVELPVQALPSIPSCTCQDVRADPGEGGYFQLAAADFNLSWGVAPNAG
jgi:hypothetical protein